MVLNTRSEYSILIWKLLTRSTRFTHGCTFYTAPNQQIQLNFVKHFRTCAIPFSTLHLFLQLLSKCHQFSWFSGMSANCTDKKLLDSHSPWDFATKSVSLIMFSENCFRRIVNKNWKKLEIRIRKKSHPTQSSNIHSLRQCCWRAVGRRRCSSEIPAVTPPAEFRDDRACGPNSPPPWPAREKPRRSSRRKRRKRP